MQMSIPEQNFSFLLKNAVPTILNSIQVIFIEIARELNPNEAINICKNRIPKQENWQIQGQNFSLYIFKDSFIKNPPRIYIWL